MALCGEAKPRAVHVFRGNGMHLAGEWLDDGACLCMMSLGHHNARLCLFYSVFGLTCANFRGIIKKRADVKNRDFNENFSF